MPVAVSVREAGVRPVVADARFVDHAAAEDPGPAHADALVAVVLLTLVADAVARSLEDGLAEDVLLQQAVANHQPAVLRDE